MCALLLLIATNLDDVDLLNKSELNLFYEGELHNNNNRYTIIIDNNKSKLIWIFSVSILYFQHCIDTEDLLCFTIKQEDFT